MGDRRDVERFLRTLRVATAVALVEHELAGGAAVAPGVTRFLALAAKGPGAWRFPAEGLASGDGLLVATLALGPGGEPATLRLQAQGAAGLDLFAGKRGVVSIGTAAPLDVAFDRDGTASVSLAGSGLAEADCAAFGVELSDDAT